MASTGASSARNCAPVGCALRTPWSRSKRWWAHEPDPLLPPRLYRHPGCHTRTRPSRRSPPTTASPSPAGSSRMSAALSCSVPNSSALGRSRPGDILLSGAGRPSLAPHEPTGSSSAANWSRTDPGRRPGSADAGRWRTQGRVHLAHVLRHQWHASRHARRDKSQRL